MLRMTEMNKNKVKQFMTTLTGVGAHSTPHNPALAPELPEPLEHELPVLVPVPLPVLLVVCTADPGGRTSLAALGHTPVAVAAGALAAAELAGAGEGEGNCMVGVPWSPERS